LRRGVAVDDHQRVVHFLLLVDGSRIVARAGQPFEVRDTTYTVRDIAADGAVRVVEADGDDVHTVPRVTEAERAEMGNVARDAVDPEMDVDEARFPVPPPPRRQAPPPSPDIRVPDRLFWED
jgi:hypothetical protein